MLYKKALGFIWGHQTNLKTCYWLVASSIGGMGAIVYLDTLLIPLSLFLIVGYHAYLCHKIKNKPSHTTFGVNKLRRTAWCLDLNQAEDKKAMLAVQTLRNTLMATIFTASITILVNVTLSAVSNNSYKAGHLFSSRFFGSKSDKVFALKYGSASLLLVISFLCSSMAVGFLIDANLLMSTPREFLSEGYAQTIFERGFALALIGNRMLCITITLLLWMLGPVPVFLSSLALIWGLHQFDFVRKFPDGDKQCITTK